ncbi:MAG: DUF1559 domain-containing protein [Planctomycetes bacterium]|nr:DUF1559 domain-containing protein [Planctomycetota bacterium]
MKPRPELPFRRLRQSGFTLVELALVLGVIVVLVSLLLPAIQQTREAARNYSCRNNLMQIGLALSNYESAWECLPPGSVNPTRPIQHAVTGYQVGWGVRILPHLDQQRAFEQFDFSAGAFDKRNSAVAATSLPMFRCPSMGSYAACHHDIEAPIDIDNVGVFILNRAITRDEITDGISNTIYVGEIAGGAGFGWVAGNRDSLRNMGASLNSVRAAPGMGAVPVNSPELGVLGVGGFSSTHLGGASFLFGDGAVRFLSNEISMTVYRRYGHRADGAIPAGEF